MAGEPAPVATGKASTPRRNRLLNPISAVFAAALAAVLLLFASQVGEWRWKCATRHNIKLVLADIDSLSDVPEVPPSEARRAEVIVAGRTGLPRWFIAGYASELLFLSDSPEWLRTFEASRQAKVPPIPAAFHSGTSTIISLLAVVAILTLAMGMAASSRLMARARRGGLPLTREPQEENVWRVVLWWITLIALALSVVAIPWAISEKSDGLVALFCLVVSVLLLASFFAWSPFAEATEERRLHRRIRRVELENRLRLLEASDGQEG